ncbi:MAG: hypothetical protein ACMXYK_00550 [Candidatus Woesearchaeota archaeon]
MNKKNVFLKFCKKRAQSSFEFVVLMAIVLMFVLLIVTIVSNRTQDFSPRRVEIFSQMISERIEREAALARSMPEGYTRYFELPDFIETQQFQFQVIQGRELVTIANDDQRYLTFLSQTIYGQVGPGLNKVMKRGSLIGFCFEEEENFCGQNLNTTNYNCFCNNEFPGDFTGTLACAKIPDLYTDCDFRFYDTYVGLRATCTNFANSVNITITNLDNNLELLHDVSTNSVNDNGLVFTFTTPFSIERSGNWLVEYSCETPYLSETFTNQFYVPFGWLQLERVEIRSPTNSCDQTGTFNYTCKENKHFDIEFRVTCMGGECGENSVWLDPE